MTNSVTPLKIVDTEFAHEAITAATRRLADQSRASSTKRAYASDWANFEAWCARDGRVALPAHPVAVAEYLRTQHEAGLAVSTIARRLCAIRLRHIAAEIHSPHAEHLVLEVMKGIRRGRKRKVVQATPVVAEQIKQMVDLIDLKTHQGRRDRALLLLGFAAALRRSELVALDIADLEFVDQGLLLTIKSSKTDQEQVGAVVPVLAETDSPYCPVESVRIWLINSALREGPAFRRLYRGDTISHDRLSDKAVVLLIKSLAGRIGMDAKLVSGHSLRRGFLTSGRGFLTSAATEKKDLRRMADQARHLKLDTTRVYVDTANAFEDHPGQGLLAQSSLDSD